MKILRFFFLVLSLFIFLPFPSKVFSQELQERKIIIFKPEASQDYSQKLFSKYSLKFGKYLKIINGVTVSLTPQLTEIFARDKNVLRIDPDVEVSALENLGQKQSFLSTASSQTIPWGVIKIHADDAWNLSSGLNVKVAVLDTGIDRDHPDLKDNLAGCLNFISLWRNCEDDNGHGTHVSGIIAAENNNIGVVGVAPKAKIYALKVLNRRGAGYLSDIIEGLDWSRSNGIQVINMSLGTTSDIISFQEAVRKVYDSGIVMVAAAGNSGPTDNSVIYPAKYPEVIAVSAIDENNAVPSWSSRGPEISLAAPGVNILSSYTRGKYIRMSGTSMAAPHTTGVVALRLFLHPAENPSQISSILKSNTDFLSGGVNLVGAGLVNAYKVVSAP